MDKEDISPINLIHKENYSFANLLIPVITSLIFG